jgi:hypothetical protein
VDADALGVDLRLERVGSGVCHVVLDPAVIEAWLQLVLGRSRSPKRPTLPGRWLDHHTVHAIMAHWRVQDGDMSSNKAGDETNRALVAYVRNLSDEELADLLLSLDPKVYQDLLERALGRQPSKRPPRVKP